MKGKHICTMISSEWKSHTITGQMGSIGNIIKDMRMTRIPSVPPSPYNNSLKAPISSSFFSGLITQNLT